MSTARWRLFRRRENSQAETTPPAHADRRQRRGRGIPRRALELATRRDHGLEVALLWDPRTSGRLWVQVLSRSSGEGFVIRAEPDTALDAFYHPFVYASPARA